MVHLGCHAWSGPTPSSSYLRLANGAVLTVEQSLRRAEDGPTDSVGGLVVLAACQSSLTEAAHDEGLTLVSAFIAAGATGVTGALWVIPDLSSSVLMCLYHREMRKLGKRPVDALRAVQLWALGERHTVPVDFPPPLARYIDHMDFRSVAVWAAFTHHG
jgi:CHAT domain-containing protein